MVRTRWKFSGQSGPPPKVVLFDRTVRPQPKIDVHFQKFLFAVPLLLVTTVKMADGSDVSVYECGACKLQMQDVNFSLCAVAHKAQAQQCILLCFFVWFSSVFKDKYCWFLRMLTMFSRVFLLAVCDPSPCGFDSQCEKNP